MDPSYQITEPHSVIGLRKIEEGMYLRFVVSHIDSEENLLKVWVQMDPLNLQRINECIQKLNDYLDSPGGYMHQRQLTLGSRYLVKPNDSDNWYRAVIVRHYPADGYLVVVHYIDYGHNGLIHVSNVRSINEKLFSIVPQATKCILAGVASTTGEAWSQNAVEYLIKILKNKEFMGTVVNVFRDIPYIQIMVNGIPLSHHLIEKRLGVPIGQNAMSQQSSLMLTPIDTYRALPIDISQEHLVYVSHIESPQKFYIQLAYKEPELNGLMEHIERYSKDQGFYPLQQIGLLPGTPCITQFSEDGAFYRAIVTCVMGNSCRVMYVDYGNSEVKGCAELKALPPQFLVLPAQARECALHTEVSVDTTAFHEAVDDKVLTCRIIRQQGTSYFVMLYCDGAPIFTKLPNSEPNYTLLNLPLGTTHNVFVTYVYSPLRLYCQLADSATQIERLRADLASFYQKLEPGANPICANECKPGKPVCAKYTEDELWYRAIVLTPEIQKSVSVKFIDYGNEDKVDLDNIKKLMPSLLQLPIQGIPIGLSGIEGFPLETLESSIVIDELERLTLNVLLVAKFESKKEDVYYVSLFNISSSPAICINSKIIDFIKMSNTNDNWRSADTAKAVNASQIDQRPSDLTEEVSYDDLYPTLLEGALEEVIVTDSSGPESFHCQIQRDSCELDALMDELAEHYNSLGENEQTMPSFTCGSLCVAKYTEDDNWYRAKIVGVIRAGTVEVLYVDYGNREHLDASRVKKILPQFLVLPLKAVECSLASFDISAVPANVVESFNATVLDNSFTALFNGKKGHVYIVELLDSQENSVSKKFQQMCKPKVNNNWESETSFGSANDKELWKESTHSGWDIAKEPANTGWKSKNESSNGAWGYKAEPVTDLTENAWNEEPAGTSNSTWNETGETKKSNQPSSFPVNKSYRKEFGEQRSFDRSNSREKRYQNNTSRDSRQTDRTQGRKKYKDSNWNDDKSSSGSQQDDSWSPKGKKNSDFSSNKTSFPYKSNYNTVKEITEYKGVDIPCGSLRFINVLKVVNPNEFYCQLVDHISELSVVMEQIGQVYGALRADELSLNDPQTGKICCALYPKDCAWYRARVKNVTGNSAEVFFVDYGSLETVPLTNIKMLKQEFLNLPVQTLKCSCLGIKPEGISWSEKDISTFREMAEEKSLLAQFVSKENDETFVVNLIPVEKLMDGVLNKEFLKSGHGKKEDAGSPHLKVPYSSSLQANLLKPVLDIGRKTEVLVTWAFSVEMFFCQLTSFASQFQDMMSDIQKEYNNMSELEAVIDRPQINTYCISQFSDDGGWYRAKIMHMQGNDISVYYVDYGNHEIVGRRRVKYILPQFTSLPSQAIKCRLNGIKANNTSTINEGIFQKYFVGNTFCTFLTDHGDYHTVDLENNAKNVATLLIDDKLAVPVDDENFSTSAGTCQESFPKIDFTQKIGKSMEVVVTYAPSPFKFWCQLTSGLQTLDEICSEIKRHYSNKMDEEVETHTNLHEGDICAAKFTEDGEWYRAIIKSFDTSKAVVLFTDYGNTDHVPLNQVKVITPELKSLPAQAVCCTLHRIPPTLTEEQQAKFIDLVDGQTMVIQLFEINMDGALVVALYDNSGQSKVNVAEKLYGEILKDVPAALIPHAVPEGSVVGYISLVNSVGEFYVQLSNDEEDIYKLKEDLAQYYEALSPEDLLIESPDLQMACCAKYSSDDCWYRAVIRSIDGEKCTVFFVDFGNEEILLLSDIKELKEEFLALPHLALKCCLSGIEPISGEIWSTSANDWLFEFTQDKVLHICFHSKDEPIPITLTLEGGGDVADNMVSAELAVRKEELLSEVESTQYIEREIEHKKENLAIVSHVSSAELFYVTFADKSDDLYNFQEKLQEMYSDESEQLIDCSVSQKCVAKYSEDEAWYRAEVVEVSDEAVVVTFIDYGNSETTTKDNLKVMDPDLCLVDAFAVACTLFGLKPNPEKLEEAKSLLEILIQDKEVKVEVVKEQVPCCVNLKVDGEYIRAELLVGDLYMETVEKRDSEEVQGQDLSSPLHADSEDQPLCLELKIDGEIKKNECSATVSHVVSAASFYITFGDKLDELYEFHEKLQQMYSDDSDQLIDCALSQKCVAKYSEDEAWYRAEVIEISEESVTVRFLDYGNSETTTKNNLKTIQSDLLSVDPFAVECILHRLEPKPDQLEEAKAFLEELILEKDICVKIVKEDQPLSVDLKIDGESIVSQLLQSNLFLETSESAEMNVMSTSSNSGDINDVCMESSEITDSEKLQEHDLKVFVETSESAEMNVMSTPSNSGDVNNVCMESSEITDSEKLQEHDLKVFLETSESAEMNVMCTPSNSGDINNVFMESSEITDSEKLQEHDLKVLQHDGTAGIRKNEHSATVRHVASPKLLYVTLSDKLAELNEFHEKLQQIYNDDSDQLTNCALSQKCVAKYSEDEAWYRAEVIEISEESVTVRFLDYGNSEMTAKNNLKTIQPELLSVDAFAIECTLYGLEPKSNLLEEAKALLEELVLEKEVCIEIIGEHHPLSVNLKIDGLSIATPLLQSNLFFETNNNMKNAAESFLDNTEIAVKTTSDIADVNLCKMYISVPLGENTITVSHVMSPSEFYVNLCDNLLELNTLAGQIETIYGESTTHDLSDISIGEICIALDPVTQKWTRACIIREDEDYVEVHFVDYGYKGHVSRDLVKQILPELQSLPFQAVRCSLGGVYPIDGEDWNDETCTFFQELVTGEEKVLIAIFQEKKHCYIVKLFDMENDVEDILIENGMACRKTSVPSTLPCLQVAENQYPDESSCGSKEEEFFSDEAELQNVAETNLSYDSEDMKSSEYVVTENADTDESSACVKDEISSEENLLQNVADANVELSLENCVLSDISAGSNSLTTAVDSIDTLAESFHTVLLSTSEQECGDEQHLNVPVSEDVNNDDDISAYDNTADKTIEENTADSCMQQNSHKTVQRREDKIVPGQLSFFTDSS